MQCLEVSGAVRPIYGSLGVKRLKLFELSQDWLPPTPKLQIISGENSLVYGNLSLLAPVSHYSSDVLVPLVGWDLGGSCPTGPLLSSILSFVLRTQAKVVVPFASLGSTERANFLVIIINHHFFEMSLIKLRHVGGEGVPFSGLDSTERANFHVIIINHHFFEMSLIKPSTR